MTNSRRKVLFLGVVLMSALAVGLSLASRDSVAESARKALRHGGPANYGRVGTPLDLLKQTDAIAKITVDQIEGPMWNSSDGSEWRGSDITGPRIYSKVRARVEEVLYGDVPTTLEIFVHGDGAKRYEGSEVPEIASISGGFIVGKTFIVLLKQDQWPMEDANPNVWQLGAGFEGNWRIDETEKANGSDSRWSMSVAALKKLFKDHWQESRSAREQRQ